MKKVLSLILCLVLMASALVSCGKDEVVAPEADRPNRTLRMAIVVADEYVDENGVVKKTTEEGIAAMQKAFNEQTEVLLATHIEFECIKESEYKTRMNAIMKEVFDEKSRQSAGKEDAMANAGDSTGTELSDDENKFPAASKAQFDILLIADADMYKEYVRKGWLVGLDSHLSGNFKPLNTKILAGAKNLATVNGTCYGVPANTAYGSYKYVKINKKVESQYSFDYKSVTSLSDVYSLIQMIELAGDSGLSYWNTEYPESFSVIGTTADKFTLSNVQYLSSDLTSNSLYGYVYDYKLDKSSISSLSNPKFLLEDESYSNYLKMKFNAQLDEKSYFLEKGETADDCIIGFVEGDYALRESDPDYYYAPVALPEFASDDIFGGMLAVSTASIDEKRSLEIVQELMTNATKTNLLNILLYGDAETNYSMEDGCVVYRKNSNYHVDRDYFFGNLCELAYPCRDFGQTAENNTYVAKHIDDLSQRQALFDEYFKDYFYEIDTEEWKRFDEYCNRKYEYLMDSADMGEFNARHAEILAEMKDENYEFNAMIGPKATQGSFTTICGAFLQYTMERSADPTARAPGSGSTEAK